MITLRWLRVLLVLLLLSIVLMLVDEIAAWLPLPVFMRPVVSGFAAGLAVFIMAYHGGVVLRFLIKNRVEPPLLRARLDAALKVFAEKVGVASRVVMFESAKPIAVTVNEGGGGCVFVSTGLVSNGSHESLVGVLAHERGHMTERHPLKQAIVLGLLAGVKISVGVPAPAVLAVLLAYLMMLREWEYVADRHAAQTVGRDCLLVTFEEYRALSGEKDVSQWAELLSGHPSLHRRVKAVTAPRPK